MLKKNLVKNTFTYYDMKVGKIHRENADAGKYECAFRNDSTPVALALEQLHCNANPLVTFVLLFCGASSDSIESSKMSRLVQAEVNCL